MIGQNFGEPVHPSNDVMITGQSVSDPEVDMELSVDKTTMDVAPGFEAPVGGILAAVDPVHETFVQDAPTAEVLPLLKPEESDDLRTRWIEIQGRFVDDPQSAVQQADTLVSEVVEKIIQMFASEHSALEVQWNQGKDLSTEDLRKSLQHYRSFFNRLVD